MAILKLLKSSRLEFKMVIRKKSLKVRLRKFRWKQYAKSRFTVKQTWPIIVSIGIFRKIYLMKDSGSTKDLRLRQLLRVIVIKIKSSSIQTTCRRDGDNWSMGIAKRRVSIVLARKTYTRKLRSSQRVSRSKRRSKTRFRSEAM